MLSDDLIKGSEKLLELQGNIQILGRRARQIEPAAWHGFKPTSRAREGRWADLAEKSFAGFKTNGWRFDLPLDFNASKAIRHLK